MKISTSKVLDNIYLYILYIYIYRFIYIFRKSSTSCSFLSGNTTTMSKHGVNGGGRGLQNLKV